MILKRSPHRQSSNASKASRLMFVDIPDESAQLLTGTSLQSNLVAFKERTSQCAYLYLDVKTGPKGSTSL